jgi:dihydroflavonol-4-reductase
MKAIVFGGTGFIGSHVVEQLHLAGHQVTAAVRDTSNTSFLDGLGIKVFKNDFSHSFGIGELIEGHEVVYNCTADTNLNPIDLDAPVEIKLTKSLIEAAASHGASRFVQLSTIVTYDFRSSEPIDESYISEPEYNLQRLGLKRERIVMDAGIATGLETIVLRPASTIGARDYKSFFSRLFTAHMNDRYPMINNGETKVSLVDTRDIGRAMVWLGTIQKPKQDNGIYLLKGYDTTWGQLKREMDQATGKMAKVLQISANLTEEQLVAHGLNPFAMKTFIVNRLWDDHKIRNQGFETKYSLTDSVEAEVNDLMNRNRKK